MSSSAVPPAKRARSPRPSLSATVLRLAAVATIADVLVWSVLFVDLLRKRSDAGDALAPPASQPASPGGGRPAPAPTPVTTRTS
jgi:hypothetical protein